MRVGGRSHSVIYSVYFFSTKALVYVTFLCCLLGEGALSLQLLFVVMALYNALKYSMHFFFPSAVTASAQLLTTTRRIQVARHRQPIVLRILLLTALKPRLAPVAINALPDQLQSMHSMPSSNQCTS